MALDGPTSEVVSAYVGSRSRSTPEMTVEPARQGPFRLHAVDLVGPDGRVLEIPQRTEPFTIRVRYELAQPLPQLDLALVLVNPSGIVALDEMFSDSGVDSLTTEPGRYLATLTVPPVLASNEYLLKIWAGAGHDTFLHRDLFSFHLWPGPGDPGVWRKRARIAQPSVDWDVVADD